MNKKREHEIYTANSVKKKKWQIYIVFADAEFLLHVKIWDESIYLNYICMLSA